MKSNLLKWVLILNLLILVKAYAFDDKLRNELDLIVKSHNSKIGISLLNLKNNDTLSINNNYHYPLQSVYKFHLALAILDKVDKKELNLKDLVKIRKRDLMVNTWSPLREAFPNGGAFSISDLLMYSISKSDNNACDILFKLVGGTLKVEKYIKSLGFNLTSIKTTEKEMHQKFENQFKNWSTPLETAYLLKKFSENKILSKNSTDFLLNLMTNSFNDPKRIKAGLPEDIELAHKTGTSGQDSKGVQAAVNDMGIIKLKNGDKYILVVYVAESFETYENNLDIISKISNSIFSYFSKK